MNGCVFKRKLPSGRITWGYSVDAGKDERGKRKQIFKSGFERKSEADAALRRMLNEKDEGELVKPDPQTFGAFIDEYLREHAPRRCELKTLERYSQLADYVRPHLAGVKLQDLTALMLERVFNHLKDSGGRDRKKKRARPLSAKTVRHIASVVNVALKKAVKLKLLKSNPMDGVELPVVPNREAKVLDSEKVTWYVEMSRANGLYEILMFAAAMGCRRGEALALQWSDLDFVKASARISKSLSQTKAGLHVKSTKGKRTRNISIPGSLVEILKFHRERQAQNRRLCGPDYRTGLDLVFCDPQGDYLRPDSITAKASLIAQKAGLEKGVSLHTMRHSHASELLAAGVPLPTVSKRLGHVDVHTTATVYAHALPKEDAAAADVWDARVQKSLSDLKATKAC